MLRNLRPLLVITLLPLPWFYASATTRTQHDTKPIPHLPQQFPNFRLYHNALSREIHKSSTSSVGATCQEQMYPGIIGKP